MSYKILKCTVNEGIATIVNSRPQALNALNSQFFSEMDRLVNEIRERADVKVLIITGEGKAFAAGADIAEMKDMTPKQAIAFSKTGQNTFSSLELLEKPVIAAVNGFALGGGCEFVMACDIRLASEYAKFGQPEVNLGLIPGYGATQRLPRLVGLGNALNLLFTGNMIDASEAYRIGLVQKVVKPEELIDEATKIAKSIVSKGPKAILLVKQVARKGLLMDFEKGCDLEAQHFGDPFGNEGAEGMNAFLERRKPNW